MDISFDQLKALIEITKEKDWIDFTQIIGSIILPLIAAALSYIFFKQHSKQTLIEKIIEKDVENLYTAAECFFSYKDSLHLFLSMQRKKISSNTNLSEEFLKQHLDSESSVFKNHKEINRAIFLLNIIGANQAAVAIKKYWERSTQIRKSALGFQCPQSSHSDIDLHINELEILFEKCEKEINIYKKNLQNFKKFP